MDTQDMHVTQDARMNRQLKAVVVGGGVAGAASAVALRRIGADVTVYEGYEDPAGPVGSFLSLAVNGLRGLDVLDCLAEVQHAGFPVARQRMLTGRGKLIADVPRGRTSEDDLLSVTVQRADLVRVLREAALRAGARIVTGRRLDGPSCPEAADADLVVGADGIWSATRGALDPAFPDPVYAGLFSVSGVSRVGGAAGAGLGASGAGPGAGGLVPGSVGAVHPGAAVAGAGHPGGAVGRAGAAVIPAERPGPDASPVTEPAAFHMTFARRGAFIHLPAPDGTWWWSAQVAAVRAPESPGSVGIDELAEVFRTEPHVVEVLRAGGEARAATLFHTLAPVRRRQDGRTVLVGDAAHPVGAGQGASMAIEDAVLLARELHAAGGEAPAALAAFDRIRVERTGRMAKAASSNRDAKIAGPLAARARDLVMPWVFPRLYPRATKWLYAYDLGTLPAAS